VSIYSFFSSEIFESAYSVTLLKGFKQCVLTVLDLDGSIVKKSGDSQHLNLKINALDNMHYCYIVRFDNTSDARLGGFLSFNYTNK